MSLCVWCLKDKMRLLNKWDEKKDTINIYIFKKPALANETCAYGKYCIGWVCSFSTNFWHVHCDCDCLFVLCICCGGGIIIWFLLSMCEWCEWFRSGKNTCKNFADAHTHTRGGKSHANSTNFAYIAMTLTFATC